MQDFPIIPTNARSLWKRKPLYGAFINDADYMVSPNINGKQIWCPYYAKWKYMIDRCYSGRYKNYDKTTVCEEWVYFSNFRIWMKKQDWKGKELDKDLLSSDVSIYSPQTCVFIDKLVNSFLLYPKASKGIYPEGVNWSKRFKKYVAKCNQLNGKAKTLGYFSSPEDAHNAWKKNKKELAFLLANSQKNKKIHKALISYIDRNYHT